MRFLFPFCSLCIHFVFTFCSLYIRSMLFYAVFKSNKDVVDALCTKNDGLCTKNDGLLYQTGPGQAESLLATENLS